jgi:hypothetical protein
MGFPSVDNVSLYVSLEIIHYNVELQTLLCQQGLRSCPFFWSHQSYNGSFIGLVGERVSACSRFKQTNVAITAQFTDKPVLLLILWFCFDDFESESTNSNPLVILAQEEGIIILTPNKFSSTNGCSQQQKRKTEYKHNKA